MRDHPKEEIVKAWLKNNPSPTLKQICAEFLTDLEAIVMAATLCDLGMDMDLKVYCRGIPLDERIQRYSQYPLWFKTFIPQDISHAIGIFKINRDADGYASDIIEDWVEEENEYVNMVKNASPFVNNETELTIKAVMLSNETDFEKNISDELLEKLKSKTDVEFAEPFDKELFYFLKLEHFSDFAQKDLNEFNEYADKYAEEFLSRDVFAKAKLSDNYVYLVSTQPICLYFDVEPKASFDPHSLSKDVFKELKGLGYDIVEDEIGDILTTLVAGRTAAIVKLLYKIAKATKNTFEEHHEITFDNNDEEAFYDGFVFNNATKEKSLKQYYMMETKLPTEKLFIKKRMDISILGENFFENQYKVFVNTRLYGRLSQLPESTQKRIMAIGNEEDRDTELFVALFKNKKAANSLEKDFA